MAAAIMSYTLSAAASPAGALFFMRLRQILFLHLL